MIFSKISFESPLLYAIKESNSITTTTVTLWWYFIVDQLLSYFILTEDNSET